MDRDLELNEAAFAYDVAGDTRREVLAALQEVVSALSGYVEPDLVLLEFGPGYQTAEGQQYVLTARSPDDRFRDALLRAYLPGTGFPITLDLDTERPEICDDLPALKACLGRYVASESTRQRLASLAMLVVVARDA